MNGMYELLLDISQFFSNLFQLEGFWLGCFSFLRVDIALTDDRVSMV